MLRFQNFSWLYAPPFLIIAGWSNDNLIPILFAKSYNIIRQFGVYDFLSKWLLCGAAACILVSCREQFPMKTGKAWIATWLVVWSMLLFEVLARFFGLLGWMGGTFHYAMFPRCNDCGSTEDLTLMLNWAIRPMCAFGVIFVAYSFIRRLIRPTSAT